MATQSELDNLAGKWFVGMYGIANEYSFILAASKAMPNSSDEDKIFKISYISLMPNFIKLKEGLKSFKIENSELKDFLKKCNLL